MGTTLLHQQTLGWLQAPEFGKSQQKHSVKINWLYGIYIKEYYIFHYYLKTVCSIPLMGVKSHVCIYTHKCFYPEELVAKYVVISTLAFGSI